jgi:hypothetical protein
MIKIKIMSNEFFFDMYYNNNYIGIYYFKVNIFIKNNIINEFIIKKFNIKNNFELKFFDKFELLDNNENIIQMIISKEILMNYFNNKEKFNKIEYGGEFSTKIFDYYNILFFQNYIIDIEFIK